LRFGRTDARDVIVENYTFDQEIARKELGSMIVFVGGDSVNLAMSLPSVLT
jgi:hypothetical protein